MWRERDRAHNIYSKINFDFVNNYLYLYPTIRPILLSGIICIPLSGKFYYPELSVSGYQQILLSMHPYFFLQSWVEQYFCRITGISPIRGQLMGVNIGKGISVRSMVLEALLGPLYLSEDLLVSPTCHLSIWRASSIALLPWPLQSLPSGVVQ